MSTMPEYIRNNHTPTVHDTNRDPAATTTNRPPVPTTTPTTDTDQTATDNPRRSSRLAQPVLAPRTPTPVDPLQSNTTPPPSPTQSDTSNESLEATTTPGHIADSFVARSLLDLPVMAYFEVEGEVEPQPFEGKVTDNIQHFQDGGIVHQVTFHKDGTKQDYSYDEILDMHATYNHNRGIDNGPIRLPDPTDQDQQNFPAPPPTGLPDEVDMPTPSSFDAYDLRVPFNSELLKARVTKRTIKSNLEITWYLKLTKTDGTTFDTKVDHATIHRIVTVNKTAANIRPPQSKPPTVSAVHINQHPHTLDGWQTVHHTVGLVGHAHIPNLEPAARKRRKPRFLITVIAAQTLPNNTNTTYLCRVNAHPECMVTIYTPRQLADSVHALEVHRIGRRRSYRTSILQPPPLPTDGELLHTPLSKARLMQAIRDFMNTLPDDPKDFYNLGFATANCQIPRSCKRHYRRAVAPVAELAASNDIAGWKCLLMVNALLLPPTLPEGMNRVTSIKQRVDLFLKGDFHRLLQPPITTNSNDDDSRAGHNPLHHIQKSSHHVAKPLHQMSDAVDRQAREAQYQLTNRSSVKTAAARLNAKEVPEPTSPGALTAALKKLHPQQDDAIPEAPPPPAQQQPDPNSRRILSQTHAAAAAAGANYTQQGGGDAQHQHRQRRRTTFSTPDPSHAPPTSLPTTEDYMSYIRRRDTGSAGGPDGTTFLHLRVLFEESDSLADSLATALNLFQTNTIDPRARNLLNAARAVAVPKDKGGIRPIAVGSTLVRTALGVAMTPLSRKLQEYFTPLQYGIGVRAGAEIMTHTIKAHLQLNPTHLVIQTDLANAFNSWSRDKLYPVIDQHFPELSHVIRAAYGNPSQVLFAEPNQPTHSIQSTVGSRQGCVAGSLAFCLALQPILQTIAHKYPDLLVLSYCDDMYIIGTPERAAHAYRCYASLVSQHLQAQLRDDKAHAYSPAASQEDITRAQLPMPFTRDGIEVLGSPMGTPTFTHDYVQTKAKAVIDAIQVLGRVPLKHARHTILQKSLSCKLHHLQRVLPTGDPDSYLSNITRNLDLKVRDLVQTLVPHTYLSDNAFEIATLPLRQGGLGYSAMLHTADPAFLASYTYAATTIPKLYPHLSPAFSDHTTDVPPAITTPYNEAARRAYHRVKSKSEDAAKHILHQLNPTDPRNNNSTHTSPDSRHLQRKISESLSDVRCDDLFRSLPTRHQAQLLSNSGDSFGFAAMPTCPELSLQNPVIHIGISRRLLLPITTCNCETRRCPVCHRNKPDPFGDHSLICQKDGNPARTRYIHDAGYLVFYNMMKSAGLNVKADTNGSLRHTLRSQSAKRPDIILTDSRPDGADTFIDYTTRCPSRQLLVTRAATIPGFAADDGVTDKLKAWEPHVRAQGDIILPICMEDGGYFSEGGHELFDLACRSLGSTKGEASAFYTYWRQRLATTNIRGVAKTILQRVPFCTGEHFPMTPHHFGTIHMGPIPAPARSTFPIDIPNHEHGRIDEDDDTEEEALDGDNDVAAS